MSEWLVSDVVYCDIKMLSVTISTKILQLFMIDLLDDKPWHMTSPSCDGTFMMLCMIINVTAMIINDAYDAT